MGSDVGRSWVQGLHSFLGVDRIERGWRKDFAARAYQVATERGVRAAWAVLLIDLPLFLAIDWSTYHSGRWAVQPAHEHIFWWRLATVGLFGALLVSHALIADEYRRNRLFAWGSAIAFPLMGAWFTVVCQTLITDASVYALFLIGGSVLFPLPSLLKLLIFPASLLIVLLGLQWHPQDPVAAYHVGVNAACVAVGAFVMQSVAMRTWVADFAKSFQLDAERRRGDELLRNVLPASVVERLKSDVSTRVQHHPAVSVLFADFVGFGRLTQELPPNQMIGLLDQLFHEFDEAADRFGVEKIKTLGDSYMAACGVPDAQPDHARRVAGLALRMISIAERLRSDSKLPVHFRIGMHTGPAIAGIIGRRKFCYDLWGDTINLAALLQSSGKPDHVHVSQAMQQALGAEFRFAASEPVVLKGRPPAPTWYLLGRTVEGEVFKDRFVKAAVSR